MSVPKIPSWVESAPAFVPGEGTVPYGTVFTDGEVDEVRSIEPRSPEGMLGEPAVNWRGVPDPEEVKAPEVVEPVVSKRKRGRPKKGS